MHFNRLHLATAATLIVLAAPFAAHAQPTAPLDGKALVWPFETGWKAITEADLAGKEALIAEIYPPLVTVTPQPGETPDAAQVRSLCEHFARLDADGKLSAAFAPPPGAAPELVEAVETEEGWILGAG